MVVGRRGYNPEQREILHHMDSVAGRATAEGVEVLKPLYDTLPAAMRKAALAMIEDFDAASVVATSRFIASGVQPFDTEEELKSLRVPTLLVRAMTPCIRPRSQTSMPAVFRARWWKTLPRM